MKTDKKLYFIVGLVVLLTMVILVFGVLFLNDSDPRENFHRYYLRLSQVSTLTVDDPVKINGVKLGKVEAMDLSGTKVVVQIRLRDDVKLTKDSEIRVQNIGIMGERQIGVLLGNSIDYWNPGDTIPGLFDAGIAEAMGVAGEVFDSTRVLVGVVKAVVDSTFATPEFRQRFNQLLDRTDSLERRVVAMIDETDPMLRQTLGRLDEAGKKVNDALDQNREPLEHLLADAQGLTTNAGSTLSRIDSLMTHVDGLMGKLQQQDNTMGILLNDRKLHDDLSKTVLSADSLFQTILKNGLDVNIDFF
ncbi:MAG TPA: MlaD family protein [Fibrobacteraceae bacterium]|nr:MlaD family protein [Fibrobacteraceae bacterium]